MDVNIYFMFFYCIVRYISNITCTLRPTHLKIMFSEACEPDINEALSFKHC